MVQKDGYFVIKGHLFAPQSSVSDAANLIIDGTDYYFEISNQRTTLTGKVEHFKIEPSVGQTARKIYLPDGQLFETYEHDKMKRLMGSGFWEKLAKTERFGWHLVPLAIATPFLAFAFYRTLIPLFISFAMFMTPTGMVQTIDKNTLKAIDLVMTDPSTLDEGRKAEVRAIFDKLVKHAEANSNKTRRIPSYQLHFRRSEKTGPNAFALPGGTIVMTDELIEMFPEDDYVLSAVLAHEIGHVEYEHSLNQLYRAVGMAAIIGLIAGDAGPLLEDIVLEGSALLALSFSRKHEMQADDFSYDILTATGERADGLIRFFEDLEEDMPMPETGEWLMTHPLSQKRIDNIKARIEAANPAAQ